MLFYVFQGKIEGVDNKQEIKEPLCSLIPVPQCHNNYAITTVII